ncbi:MAG: hypothetical protein K0R18_1072 [Bacillales bacterium]|jgi:hypothetical protein|nr:hypothetical protein [Bacillales bacterium]
MSNTWISYHAFLWDYTLFDEFLCDLFLELKKHSIKDFFFIRYWKGGPHIRLRVQKKNSQTENDAHRILTVSLEKIIGRHPEILNKKIDKLEFYKNSFLDGQQLDIKKLPWYSNGTIVKIPYERENERYGGKEFISLSETAFVKSTHLVQKLLGVHPDGIKKIIIFFSTTTQVLDYVYSVDFADKINFINFSYEYWNQYYFKSNILNDTAERIWKLSKINNMSFYDSLPTFRDLVKQLKFITDEISEKKGNRYSWSVLFSQIHMFANRLGVSIEVEHAYYKFINQLIMKGGKSDI